MSPRLEDLFVRPALLVPSADFLSFSVCGPVNCGQGWHWFPMERGATAWWLSARQGDPGTPGEVEGRVRVAHEPKGQIDGGARILPEQIRERLSLT
ncbi:MAG: hypothetical protein ABSF61_12160 [Anaerolineales bacterium]